MSLLIQAIRQQNDKSHVVFSGLIPRPMDYPASRKLCESYNSSMRIGTQEMVRKHGWNVSYTGSFYEFLELNGCIKDSKQNFVDDIFLSETGYRLLHASWLRQLGFFPKKACKL